MSAATGLPKSILLALLTTTLGLAALEVGARLLVQAPRRGAPNEDLRYTVDADILWIHVPGQHVVQPGAREGSVVEYRINAAGLRGPDIPAHKTVGEFRILTIGDSVTLGYGVTEGEEYPHRLEALLDARRPDLDIRVLNAGVSAYATLQELEYVRKRGLGYEPDLAVIGFVMNDISTHNRRMYDERFGRLRSRQLLEEGAAPIAGILERSRLVVVLSGLVKFVRARTSRRRENNLKSLFTAEKMIHLDTPPVREAWEGMLSEMDRLVDLLDRDGVPAMIVAFPMREQLEESPAPDRPQRALEAFCAERRIPFVNLLPRFLERDAESLYLDHVHLTAEGYELAARAIGEAVLAAGLLPADSLSN